MMGGFGGSMGGVGAGGKAKRPIGVKFEIPYFTTSGIQVRYLKIIEPKVSFCNDGNFHGIQTDMSSSNTLHCLGCDTSPKAVTLPFVCRMFSNGTVRPLLLRICHRAGFVVCEAWRRRTGAWKISAGTFEDMTIQIVHQVLCLQNHVSQHQTRAKLFHIVLQHHTCMQQGGTEQAPSFRLACISCAYTSANNSPHASHMLPNKDIDNGTSGCFKEDQ